MDEVVVARIAVLDAPRLLARVVVEMAGLSLGMSVPIPFAPCAPQEMRVVLIEARERSGLLLPQVPDEFGWDRAQYLDNLCFKAGLAARDLARAGRALDTLPGPGVLMGLSRRRFLQSAAAACLACAAGGAAPGGGPPSPWAWLWGCWAAGPRPSSSPLWVECRFVRCTLCPAACRVGLGERGADRLRENQGGQYQILVYDNPCVAHLNPIEKESFLHVLPGSRSFSLATRRL